MREIKIVSVWREGRRMHERQGMDKCQNERGRGRGRGGKGERQISLKQEGEETKVNVNVEGGEGEQRVEERSGDRE